MCIFISLLCDNIPQYDGSGHLPRKVLFVQSDENFFFGHKIRIFPNLLHECGVINFMGLKLF